MSGTAIIILAVVIIVIGIGVGVVLLFFNRQDSGDDEEQSSHKASDEEAQITNYNPDLEGYVYVKPPVIDKEKVVELEMTLSNVCIITHRAIECIEENKSKDIVVALGDTGSGKSTLLTALIYGSQDLKIEKIGKKNVI